MMRNRIVSLWALLWVLTLGLSGCQSISDTATGGSDDAYWQQMESRLNKVSTLKLQGKLGLMGPQGRHSGTLIYGCSPDGYSLELLSPIASQVGTLTCSLSECTLEYNGESRSDPSGRELIRSALGIELSPEDLKALFLGIPPNLIRHDHGSKASAESYSYTVTYDSYREFSGLALPTAITVADHLTDSILKIKINEVNTIIEQ